MKPSGSDRLEAGGGGGQPGRFHEPSLRPSKAGWDAFVRTAPVRPPKLGRRHTRCTRGRRAGRPGRFGRDRGGRGGKKSRASREPRGTPINNSTLAPRAPSLCYQPRAPNLSPPLTLTPLFHSSLFPALLLPVPLRHLLPKPSQPKVPPAEKDRLPKSRLFSPTRFTSSARRRPPKSTLPGR